MWPMFKLSTDWLMIIPRCILIFDLISVHWKLRKRKMHAHKVIWWKKNTTLRNKNMITIFHITCSYFIQDFTCWLRWVGRDDTWDNFSSSCCLESGRICWLYLGALSSTWIKPISSFVAIWSLKILLLPIPFQLT